MKVTQSLRLFQNAKRVGLAGHCKVLSIVRSNLKEDSSRVPTFVKLSGRVKKTRAITRCSCASCSISQCRSYLLKFGLDIGRLLNVTEQRQVVTCFYFRQKCSQ